MDIRKKMQDFLGITDVLQESAKWNKELSSQSGQLAEMRTYLDRSNGAVIQAAKNMRDESLRLRELITQHWADNKPASIEAIDAIFKETRDRLDLVMVLSDQLRDLTSRRY